VRLAPGDLDARDAWVGYLTNAPAIAGGSRQKAEQQVAELTALSPSKGAALKGRMHFNEKEWKEAEAAYGSAIAADPGVPEYHYELGFSRQQQQNYVGAVEAFEKALSVDPEFMAALYQIGRSSALSGQNLERGIDALETYLDRPARRGEPAHQHAHWRLGMVYEHKGEEAYAAESYRAALGLDPEHPAAKKALNRLDRSSPDSKPRD
jgi:tetratricopeptide (TPR) repeat protein